MSKLIHLADSKDVLDKNGVDPYVFIRFLNMMAKALIPVWLLSWAILLPLNSANTGVEGKEGLDQLTAGNIGGGQQNRFWAHLILDYIFICEPICDCSFLAGVIS